MSNRKRKALAPPDGLNRPSPKPHVIRPTAVYGLESAQSALTLTRSTLGREIRLGRLRVAKRAGRYYILGAWLLAWIEAGEVRRRQPADGGEGNGDRIVRP